MMNDMRGASLGAAFTTTLDMPPEDRELSDHDRTLAYEEQKRLKKLSKEQSVKFVEALYMGEIVGRLFPAEYNILLQTCNVNRIYAAVTKVLPEVLRERFNNTFPGDIIEEIAVKIATTAVLTIEESAAIDLGQRMNGAILDFLQKIAETPEGKELLTQIDTETPKMFSKEIAEETEYLLCEIVPDGLLGDLFHDPDLLASLRAE